MTLLDISISTLLFGEFSNYENKFTMTTDSDNVTTLYLNGDIILNGNDIISNSYIQLPQGVVFDGNNHYINLSNTTQCRGIIQCIDTSEDSRAVIKNLGIKNGNLKEGTSITAGSAYLLRSMSALYVDITDCYSTGPINAYCGGLVPDGRAGGGEFNDQDITITNCYNTGTIGSNAGGLCGYCAGSYGRITLINCYNTGTIGSDAGGLCGEFVGYMYSSITITNCYNTGNIVGNYAGGLCGRNAGYMSTNFAVTNCYNTGTIGAYAGGLCGAYIGKFTNVNNGTVIITNCYNTGTIGSRAGGLCGPYAAGNRGNINITNCYNTGNIVGNYAGGLCGLWGYSADEIIDSKITITNCYNTGDVDGQYAGGLCGSSAGKNGNINITNCYNTGTINITANYAGGLCGSSAGDNGNINITNCYNTGTIINEKYAGGLCGSSAGNNGNINITNCYNTGTIINEKSKSIAGSFSITVISIVMDCVYTSVDTSQNGDSYATLDISDIYNTNLDGKFTTDSSFVRDVFGIINEYPILSVFREPPFSPPMNYYKADAILNNSLANRVITNLTDADLSGVDLAGVDLSGAVLTGAKTGPLLSGPINVPSNYQTISGSNEIWIVGSNVNLTGADLTSADFTGADLTGVNFTGVDLTGSKLLSATNIQHAIFTNASGPSIKYINIDTTSFTLSSIL